MVGALTPERRPYILDDGNWSMQGTPESPTHRSVSLVVDGTEMFGFYPTWQRENYSQALARPGCFLRADALAWRGDPLAPGQMFEIFLKAGWRHNYGPQGDDPGDYMEWGSGDPTDAAHELVATTGIMTVPGGGSDIDICEQLATGADNVRAEQALMTATSPEAWIRDNSGGAVIGGEAGEILRLVVYKAFKQEYPAKELKSHAGRAASGIAQNGRTSMNL